MLIKLEDVIIDSKPRPLKSLKFKSIQYSKRIVDDGKIAMVEIKNKRNFKEKLLYILSFGKIF